MNPQLTNLQKFLEQLTPYNNVDRQRGTAIGALIDYVEALYGELSTEEKIKLERLLYQYFRTVEANYGL